MVARKTKHTSNDPWGLCGRPIAIPDIKRSELAIAAEQRERSKKHRRVFFFVDMGAKKRKTKDTPPPADA